jgi:thiol-disulfide isomerase/thioredoxin
MRRAVIILISLAAIAASTGYFIAMTLSRPGPEAMAPALPPPDALPGVPPATDLTGQRRPDFLLEDLAGTLVSSGEFDGQVVLVNFWASWCAPCVEEMPLLSGLQRQYGKRGFRVVGIAVEDPDRARAFVRGMALDYTLLFGLTGAAVANRDFGNPSAMLPYSVLVDRSGTIRWAHLGALSMDRVGKQLLPLLGPDGRGTQRQQFQQGQ